MSMMASSIEAIQKILNDLEDEELTTEDHCDLDDLNAAIDHLTAARQALTKGQSGKLGLASRNEFGLLRNEESGQFQAMQNVGGLTAPHR
jgi:hypothetical protein